MMKKVEIWIKVVLFNFLLVAILGVLMRYNLAFSLPGLQQKMMQESHSHFAFYGWVSAAIYLFVLDFVAKQNPTYSTQKYQLLMIFNQIGSYGMLVTFLYGGYYWLSIAFASVALFTGFAYYILLLCGTRGNRNSEIIWLKAGAFFATFSAIGIFGLAYFSSQKEEFSALYRASTYFYLHYQYNGFFLFSCLGILLFTLKKYGIQLSDKLNRIIFYLLFSGCFFGFGLSVLWMKIPPFIYGFVALISLVQLVGASLLSVWIWKNRTKFLPRHSLQKILFSVVGCAFILKFILQFLSVIPALGNLAFYNLNIVIAYLHLVLLMGISLFLIWKIREYQPATDDGKMKRISLCLLIFGIVLNEVLLALAGGFSAILLPFPAAPYALLFASAIILTALILLFSAQWKTSST